MSLDAFWRGYELTLHRVRLERPATVEQLAAILNDFQPPSAGVAFFGNNADEHLSDALAEAGWCVHYIEGDYLWEAHHDGGGQIHYVEGDVYPGPYRTPPEAREP